MGLAPYGEPKYADLIREHLHRPEGRRLVPHGHVVLQLLPGLDDDVAEVRPALRRPAAEARDADRAARDGHRRVDPTGHRRDHAAHGAPRSRADRDEEPLPRRRRRAQLRRQRTHSARRAVREHLDPARRRRRRRRARRGAVHLVPAARQRASRRGHRSRSTARCSGRAFPTKRSAPFSTSPARCITSTRPTKRWSSRSRTSWRRRTSSAGSRTAWSSGRGRSARAASSAMRAARRCSP